LETKEIERNPAYQFVSTDTNGVIADLIEGYELIMKTTVRPASPEMQLIRWIAHVIIQDRVLNNWTGNQNIPSRADGENLDALAELTYIQSRPEAEAATCKMRFFISQPQDQAILIPAGTRVTDKGNVLVWETEADHYIPAGESSIEAVVRCQTAGTAGNGYAAGQINTLVDVYEYYSGCANISISDGGSDVPTDEEYYQLMRASMDAYSCAGARGAYIYWAMQVSTEIADVVANSPTPGIVKVYVLMDGGTLAGEEIKSKVLAACSADERRPLTDLVFVEDAEIVPYDIDLTYYIPRHSTRSGTEIAAAVHQAVDSYITWQSSKLGRDINPSKLISLLMQTGIKRVDVRSPVFTSLRDGNLALSADMSYDASQAVPQLAQAGGIQVLNGGYEDE
jgi:phage-related baseplate assembly protein